MGFFSPFFFISEPEDVQGREGGRGKWPAVAGHVTLSLDMWASQSEAPASFAASSAGITPFLSSADARFFFLCCPSSPLSLLLLSLFSIPPPRGGNTGDMELRREEKHLDRAKKSAWCFFSTLKKTSKFLSKI